MNFQHLIAYMLGNTWLLEEQAFHKARIEIVERRIVRGEHLSAEEILAIKYDGENQANGLVRHWDIASEAFIIGIDGGGLDDKIAVSTAAGGSAAPASQIAVINVAGMIMQHSSQVDNISGPSGTSCERLTQSLRAALADPSVKAICFNFNSPGGGVYGIEALGNEMFAARGQKPIVAQVNSMCASAAYWLATQADEIVITPGGEVGSIGAYGLHEDKSKAAAAAGVRYTFISAGKYKVEGNSFEPLSDEALAALQKKVDSYYGTFVNAVARGRGTTAKDVRGGMGEGRMELAADALKMNMGDRIGTLDQTLTRYARMKPMAKDAKGAQAETITLHSEAADGARITTLEGEFPALLRMSDDFIRFRSTREEKGIRVDERPGEVYVSFELANAVASYQFATRVDEFTCEYSRVPFQPARAKDAFEPIAMRPEDSQFIKSHSVPNEEISATAKAEAFRRRRHALEQRARRHALEMRSQTSAED